MQTDTFVQWRPIREGARICLACGKPLEPGLQHVGSLRCLDCREAHRQLDPLYMSHWYAAGARV